MERRWYAHLEGDDGDAHHAQPDHGERVFPSEEARIEEADTGNHDPHESGGCQCPGDVSGIVDECLVQILAVVYKVTGWGNDERP